MNPDIQKAERLFEAARQLDTPEQRAAFLQAACGQDEQLRRRVEGLLQAMEEAGTFLDRPVSTILVSLTGSAETARTPAEKEGDRIGHYKLLEQIGEGGCGVVYMAEQAEPVRRRVALKIIKLGMDTKQVIARFEAERQALALMDHPNIAKVLEAGATETGRPFFVMELVRGIRITDYCDQNNLPTAERLDLFIQVCHAVQHAHQKGIIHRDIKPSNILVTLHDGTPVPKVIDFGIAKATAGQSLTDKTLYTAFEQFVGTPAYMSPEQAEMSGLDIDTRSDIYSLGVLLYELLTGKTPFDPKRLVQAGLDEIRRIIREEEPPRPSTKLSTLVDEDRTNIAKRRHTDPPRLIYLLRGDLDWIVMKCLEKDRTRRYETANGLGLDVKRHLGGEPIAARPPSTLYRLQKVARRHKLAFTAASLVAAALVIALGVSSWALLGERDARRRAQTAEKMALTEAERANGNAAKETDQRKRAESNELEAKEHLVRISVANGSHLVEQGDQFGGLLWYVEALRLDQGSTREAIHRMRIGSLLAACPKLLQLWIEKGPISSAAFSPDGNRLAMTRRAVSGVASDSASDKIAQIWDVNTGAPRCPPMVHTSIVWSAVFSADGRKLLTRSSGPGGGGYEQAQVWDAETGHPLTPPLQQTGWVHQAVFSPNGAQVALWVTGRDRQSNYVQLWNLDTSTWVWPPVYIQEDSPNPTDGSSSLCFSPDGENLLIRRRGPSATTSELMLLDTHTGKQVVPRWNTDTNVFGAEFSNGGEMVATIGSNGIVRVVKTINGEPITSPLKHNLSFLEDAVFSSDSRLLATSGRRTSGGRWERESAVWDVPTSSAMTKSLDGTVRFRADGYPVLMTRSTRQQAGEMLQMFDAITGKPSCPALEQRWGSDVVLAPRDLSFAKWGWEGVVWLWELSGGVSPQTTFQDAPGDLFGSFSEGGDFMVAGTSEGIVRVVKTDNAQESPGVMLQRNGWTRASVSADGTRIATFGTNGTAQIWSTATGQAVTPPLRHRYSMIKRASFSPDGSRLATISAKPTYIGSDRFDLWDVETGKSLTDTAGASRAVNFATFSPDSKRLLTAGSSGSAYLWDAATGREICAIGNLPWHPRDDELGAVSPDGRWIVIPGESSQVWDVRNGEPVGRPMKHAGGVQQAAFSPDGRWVATAGGDSTARIWDAKTGEPITAAMKHPGNVHRVEFSPNGRLLATTCADNKVRVWDTATGEAVLQPLYHPAGVYEITFNHSGKLLTACYDGRMRIWEIPADPRPVPDLVSLAQLLAGRRIDRTSGLEPLDNDAMRGAWETLRTRYPNEFKRTSLELLARDESQAQHCEQVGLWGPAIWHLNHLIEVQPRLSKWRKWRGWLYARSGDKEKSEADFSAAIQLGAVKDDLWWQVAQAWQARRQPDEALSAMERISGPGPRNCGFWVTKALMLEQTNRLDDAFQALERALSLAPGDDFVWRALVNLANRHARLDKAVQLFEEASRMNPVTVELHEFTALNRGILLERTNQLKEAYEVFSAGLQLGGLSPRSVSTREQLLSRRSDVLKRLDRHTESIEDFEKSVRLVSLSALDCNDRAWELATGQVEDRDPERAVLLAKKAVEQEPKNVLYVDTLGVAYYRAGDWLKAAEALQEAVKLSASDPNYPVEVDLLFLAMTYHQLGDARMAKEYHQKAIQARGSGGEAVPELESFRDEAGKLLGVSRAAVK